MGKVKETVTVSIPWACPKCEAKANKHGKGDCFVRHSNSCSGFTCECDPDEEGVDADDHGHTFSNVCNFANCDHCGWTGSFPQKPKGLQAWEKKALEAGWSPPAKRAKELGLK